MRAAPPTSFTLLSSWLEPRPALCLLVAAGGGQRSDTGLSNAERSEPSIQKVVTMAAIYSGVHLKLKSTKTSWQDKLKIAHFAWISQQCFLPNKEQVLLDWVSHALVGYYSKKFELEDDVVANLWAYFENAVHSKKLQNFLKDGKTINLRFAVAQVMNDRISKSISSKAKNDICTVLSCCQGILSNPALAIIYTAKCELMVELLSKLSLLACQQLTSEEPLVPRVFDVIQLTFNQYLLIQRQQVNAIRVFGHVTDHLFQPCLLLRHLLSTRTWVRDEDSRIRHHLAKEIRNKTEVLLQTGIFQAELLASYREELLSGKEPQEKKKGSLKTLLMPVGTILNKLCDRSTFKEPLYNDVVTNSVPLLYKLFLDSYCKEENQLVCFHMAVRFFDCIQITHLAENEEMLSPSDWSMSLLAVEQLLNLVLDHDIYNVAVDRIRHQEAQFKFYCRLAEILVNHPQPSIAAWFRCLRALILLNHLILEPNLDDLVSSAWIDADITEMRVKKAQEVLISTLFQTYTKLRQFPRLFEEVLSVICRPAVEELRRPVLSPGLTLKLCECLLELPPNQILDIWALILEKCCSLIIPDVKDEPDMALKLLSVSSLLHSILFNMKSLDSTTPVPVIHRTQKLMDETLQELIRPLLNLHQGRSVKDSLPLWLEKASDSALLLMHTWVEVDTMLSLNCSKYVSVVNEPPAHLDFPIKSWDFATLLPDVDCWKTMVRSLSHLNSMSKYCLELLSLQKMKRILKQTSFQSETVLHSLHNATVFLLHSETTSLCAGANAPWNGVASAVNDSTYPVAHWHLIVSNLPILVPYLSTDDFKSVADVLLKTLTQTPTDSENHDLFVTLGNVSTSLLHSANFLEIRGLHCAFITSLIQRCAQIVCDEQDAASDVLGQLSADTIPWHEECPSSCKKAGAEEDVFCEKPQPKDVLSICWETMKSVAQSILSSAKADSLIALDEDQLEHLCSLVRMISIMEPDSLMPVDHTRCFLFLISLVTRVRDTSCCSLSKILQLQKTCFHLLTCLQSGIHANSVFKALHASDILEVVMASLFAASKDFSRCEDTEVWFDLLRTTQTFLEHFIQMIIKRKQSLRINLEKFVFFLMNCKPYSDATSKKNYRNWSPQSGQLLLVALSTMCRVTIPYLLEQQEKKQLTSETLSTLLQQTVIQMGKVICLTMRGNISDHLLPPFFVTCVTTLLEAELSLASYGGSTNGQISVKSTDVCKDKTGLLHNELYSVFCSQTVKALGAAEDRFQFLQSALQFLTIFCSVPDLHPGPESIIILIFSSLQKLLAGSWMTVQIIQSLEAELIKLVAQLVVNCTPEEFYVMMKLVLQGIEVNNLWKQTDKEVLSAIILMKLLLNCQLNRDNDMFFWSTVPQIMTALSLLTKEACKDQSLISTIVIPILEIVAILLRRGVVVVRNPHHVTLAFSILLIVPLDRVKREDYYSIFLGTHEVLFSVLQYHPTVMLKAVPSFLNSFNRLVTSVMHEGRQKGEKGATFNFEDILKCSHLVERMYTHIASKTEDFTVFSAFIVSQYVNELQKVTLHPAVKKHLTEGMYHILDLCIERDIKFLNSSLQMGVREVFKELYNDYIHYHKTKNQGEKKYTA